MRIRRSSRQCGNVAQPAVMHERRTDSALRAFPGEMQVHAWRRRNLLLAGGVERVLRVQRASANVAAIKGTGKGIARMRSSGSPNGSGSPSYRFAAGLQVDSELLAFLVEVAAFQAERAGGLGDIAVIAVEFGETVARSKSCTRWASGPGQARSRIAVERLAAIRSLRMTAGTGKASATASRIDFGIGEKQQAFDYIAQFANVAGPGVLLERCRWRMGVKGTGFHPFCALTCAAK